MDRTLSERFPFAAIVRAGPMDRYVFIDASTGEVITPTKVSSPDILRKLRFRRAPNGIPGLPLTVEGRKMTLAQERRAHLMANRMGKRVGAKGQFKQRQGASVVAGKHLVRVPSTLVAKLVAQGYFEPQSGRPGRPDSDRSITIATGTQTLNMASNESSAPNVPVQSTPADRSAVSDFKAEADRLSLPLGTAPSDEEALRRLMIVAADAKDIFPNTEAAIAFLTARSLDERGRNGVQILRQKGLPGVLSSLDQRRFGYSG